MQNIIKKALIRAGIRVEYKGFKYLCKGVEIGLEKPEYLDDVCKKLYPAIAEACGVEKASSVERCIRTAIETTYIAKSFVEINRMFKMQTYTIDDKPTASQLINLIVVYIQLELYKED